MATIWVTDREPGIRLLFGELIPDATVVDPVQLPLLLRDGTLPDALVVDGTQLFELPARLRTRALGLGRVLICTGMALTSIPMHLVAGPSVAVLAKPFCFEDLEAAVAWLREVEPVAAGSPAPMALASAPAPGRHRRRTAH